MANAEAPRRLEAVNLTVHFGGLTALDSVSLELNRGEILGLIGPNGAGKTTLVNALTGFQTVMDGHVQLGSKAITKWSAQRRARGGLVRSFQAVRLFPHLTVAENVEAGALGVGCGRTPARQRARTLLEDFGLTPYAQLAASGLPHGIARRVGIVRALGVEPEFLFLDEPAAGLDERESDELGHMLVGLREKFGCGLCIVDHDMRLVLGFCERIHVLASGRTLAVGSPREVRANRAVITAYLGD